MDFGKAIIAMKQGKAIQRKVWNGKGLFVVKQIPASITADIILKKQSLPQSAKDILLSRRHFTSLQVLQELARIIQCVLCFELSIY